MLFVVCCIVLEELRGTLWMSLEMSGEQVRSISSLHPLYRVFRKCLLVKVILKYIKQLHLTLSETVQKAFLFEVIVMWDNVPLPVLL